MAQLRTVGDVNQGKSDFIAQFVNRDDVKTDFPNGNERLALAYSMYARKNSVSEDHPFPKKYVCNFIEPGLVFYQDLGECKVCSHAMTCEKKLGKPCDTPGEMVLVKQEALTKMAKSFEGRPVLDVAHADVKGSTIADGDAEGMVTRVWFDEKIAWWMCEFFLWDVDAMDHAESLAYSVSCAYDPTEVNGGGTYHSSEYQEEVKDGVYTHLAIVTNPRYEGARISLSNSKGGSMFEGLKFWKKGERKNAAPVDPKEMINVDGQDVPLGYLVAALPDEPKKGEPKFNDETGFDTPKGPKTLGELKQAYRNKMKNADDSCPSCKGSGKKNANDGDADDAAKLAEEKKNADDAAAAAKIAEEKKNADDAAAAAKLAEEKKNADDAAKLADEKKNADDAAAAKLAEEKKNADDAAAAAKAKEESERRNAGKAAFKDLRNAASSRQGEAVSPVVSKDERLAAGASRYGSAK